MPVQLQTLHLYILNCFNFFLSYLKVLRFKNGQAPEKQHSFKKAQLLNITNTLLAR
jgi:hypothetical protein